MSLVPLKRKRTVLPLAVDPSGWTTYIGGGLDGTPPHRVIYHYGLGDAQVTWLAARKSSSYGWSVIF